MSSKGDNNVAIINDSSEEPKNNPIVSQKHIQTSLKNDLSSEECLSKPRLAGRARIPSDKNLSSLPQKFKKTGNKKDYEN